MRLPFAAVAAATLTPTPDDGETRLDTPTSPVEQGHVDGPLGIGEPFGTRYRILRALGAGGMGVVYHAWDEVLGVAVALKVIRPEVMSDPASARDVEKRFKRELLLARQVTHRNVVRIHDLGELNGIKYLTMPFVGGQDLARIIRQSERLPVPRALAIAREIAAGLAAAHEAGVVHRDLKPENIMVEGEHHAQIMDFGISRSSRAAALAARPRGAGNIAAGFDDASVMAGMTMAGAVVGTVQYMAPEQARGQDVDHRADIYAFGLIFRDMLVGSRQHAGQSALDEMMARIQAAPAGPRAVDERIPETLDRIITRCLEPDPAARYESTQQLVADLDRLDTEASLLPEPKRITRRLVAAVSMVMTALLGVTWWVAQPPPEVVQPPPTSVLIADFENRTGDPVFEGSLEQSLAIAMEGSPIIALFSQQNARAVAVQLVPASKGRLSQEVGQLVSRREGIKVLLAGSIAPADGKLRLTLRATDAATDQELASASRDVAGKSEVLEALGAVAGRVRRELGETTTESARVVAAETFTAGSVEAMRAYAQGQELLHAGKYTDALNAYEEALKHDPNLGRAHAAIGSIYVNLKQIDLAEAAFKRALKLLDRMSDREKYRTLASYYLGVARNQQQAIENYEALIRTFPGDNVAYNNLALAYLYSMDVGRAREVARKGLEVHPRNLMQRTNYAAYSVYGADFETAAREAETVLKENPGYEFAYLPLALSFAGRGDLPAARAAYARLSKVSDAGRSLAILGEADLEMYRGAYPEALDMLRAGIAIDQKLQSKGELAIKHLVIGEARLATGNTARAVAEAQAAYRISTAVNVAVPAARVLLAAGQDDAARRIAMDLEKRLQSQTISYSKLILGELALKHARFVEAIDALRDAQKRHDSWLARFLLGRTYLEAGGHEAEALEELERCYKRRGEAADLFFSDSPSTRYLPPLYYWLGRAREAVGASESAAAAYGEYIKARADAPRDPLLADARRRLGS